MFCLFVVVFLSFFLLSFFFGGGGGGGWWGGGGGGGREGGVKSKDNINNSLINNLRMNIPIACNCYSDYEDADFYFFLNQETLLMAPLRYSLYSAVSINDFSSCLAQT